MFFDAFRLEVLDEQKNGDDTLLVGEQLSYEQCTLRLIKLLIR